MIRPGKLDGMAHLLPSAIRCAASARLTDLDLPAAERLDWEYRLMPFYLHLEERHPGAKRINLEKILLKDRWQPLTASPPD